MTLLSRSLLAVTVAATCLVPAGCYSLASHRAKATAEEVTPTATSEVPFEMAWELQLPGQVERSWVGEQIPDLVFFQIAKTHEIHCVDAKSGQTRWVSEQFRHPILGEAFVHHQVQPGEREKEVIVDDRLYIVVDDTLFCLDIASGQRIWHLVLPFAPSTGPMAAGATEGNLRVFIGDWNNKVQVIGIHQPTSDRQKKFPYVVWQMNTPGAVLAQGTESEELTYIGDASGRLHCYKLDRTLVWEVETGGAVDGGATTRGRTLYAGNDANAIHAINRLTGERLGQFNLQGQVRQRPFWFSGEPERLYVWVDSPDPAVAGLVALKVQPDNIPHSDATRYAIEVVRMGQEWAVAQVKELVGATPLHLYLGDPRSKTVKQIHRGTGEITKSIPANALVQNERIQGVVSYKNAYSSDLPTIAYSSSGHVICWRTYGFVPTPAEESLGLTRRNPVDPDKSTNKKARLDATSGAVPVIETQPNK